MRYNAQHFFLHRSVRAPAQNRTAKYFHSWQECRAVIVANTAVVAVAAAAGGISVHDFEIRPENLPSQEQQF